MCMSFWDKLYLTAAAALFAGALILVEVILPMYTGV